MEDDDITKKRNEYIAKISHDMRSPLNGIIGFAEIMYNGKVGDASKVHQEYLSDILTCAKQLLTLVNDIVDLSRAESGKMDFYPEPVDLKNLLEETQRIFQSLISRKKINVTVDIDPTVNTILIDPNRFKQVINNYVSNALKCTPIGGHITLRVRSEKNNWFCLEVIDTGVGIRAEDLNRLFVEFQQLDPVIAKKYPSTGLGLAITKHIVEAQGGEVGVKSTFGKGSTFYAILPCHPENKR